MVIVTPEVLSRAIGGHVAKTTAALTVRVPIWLNYGPAAGIENAADLAIFIAQCAHESDRFRTTSEYWGPTAAQARYEGRRDLGNTQPGDGSLFRGHGDIQYTGRANHRLAQADIAALGFDAPGIPSFEREPNALTQMPWAALSALGYWKRKRLHLACASADPVLATTRAINGGTNGLADRRAAFVAIGVAMLGHPNVRAFQRATTGLSPDGVAGPRTWAVLVGVLRRETFRGAPAQIATAPDVVSAEPVSGPQPGGSVLARATALLARLRR